MTITISREELDQCAADALHRPSHFFTSDPDAYTTHGTILGQHRDSSTISRSNYRVALAQLQAIPEGEEYDTPSVYEHHSSHFAVGWLDEIMVRVRDSEGEYTPQFVRACELRAALEQYPILDEMDHSELEHEEIERYWPQEMSHIRWRLRVAGLDDAADELDEDATLAACWEWHSEGDYPTADEGWPEMPGFIAALIAAGGNLAALTEGEK